MLHLKELARSRMSTLDCQSSSIGMATNDQLELEGTIYNALDDERWTYDNADDLEPRLEITPAQFEAFRAYASATHKF